LPTSGVSFFSFLVDYPTKDHKDLIIKLLPSCTRRSRLGKVGQPRLVSSGCSFTSFDELQNTRVGAVPVLVVVETPANIFPCPSVGSVPGIRHSSLPTVTSPCARIILFLSCPRNHDPLAEYPTRSFVCQARFCRSAALLQLLT
jgi:hypothetical protein